MAKWKYFSEAEFIWNGAWNDSTLIYKGIEINSTIVVDTMWERFNDYCEDENIEPTDENFDLYMSENVDEIEELLEIAIGNAI